FIVFSVQGADGIRDATVTGVQTCALPISVYIEGAPCYPGYLRDPWSTAAQMPGVTSSTFDVAGNNSYQQSAMQIHGSTQAEQVYSFNGLDLNWLGASGGYTQFYTNHDSFDEFQVVSDNAPASVPIGGIYMNMVTKSGSNQLHGQAALYYLTAATQAGVKQPLFQGSPVSTGSPFNMTRDTSASLGGPIMRDRW